MKPGLKYPQGGDTNSAYQTKHIQFSAASAVFSFYFYFYFTYITFHLNSSWLCVKWRTYISHFKNALVFWLTKSHIFCSCKCCSRLVLLHLLVITAIKPTNQGNTSEVCLGPNYLFVFLQDSIHVCIFLKDSRCTCALRAQGGPISVFCSLCPYFTFYHLWLLLHLKPKLSP